MEKIKIGEWLKQRRLSCRLTHKELADLVGCSYHTINNIEKGFNTYFKSVDESHPYRPGIKLMEAIANQFEKSMEDLYKETDYQDLTVKKQGFGHKLPGQSRNRTPKKEENKITFKLPKDRELPPIKFFVFKEKYGTTYKKVLVRVCDTKEFAVGYVDGAENQTNDDVDFKIYQGYLKEVKIEKE